jgi:hypothetical protein
VRTFNVRSAAMPAFSLREGEVLHPLAPFKVLAVMCHPEDRAGREAMAASIARETGAGNMRRQPLNNKEFMAEVGRISGRAGLVGTLLLTRLQLFEGDPVRGLPQRAVYPPSTGKSAPVM